MAGNQWFRYIRKKIIPDTGFLKKDPTDETHSSCFIIFLKALVLMEAYKEERTTFFLWRRRDAIASELSFMVTWFILLPVYICVFPMTYDIYKMHAKSCYT